MLSITDLTAGYGKLTILHDVSLAVPAGQFAAILGPNGSGKSTLLKTIVGLTTIERGAIEFDGQPIAGRRTETIRGLGLAYVPQRENVFKSMTVRENLLLAVRGLNRQDAWRCAGRMLWPLSRAQGSPGPARRQPQRRRAADAGHRARLAGAAQAHDARRTERRPLAPLRDRSLPHAAAPCRDAGITLVVVEQNARSVLRWCDYAYLLREGQIAFQGAAADLLADEETVKSYLGVKITRKDTVPT